MRRLVACLAVALLMACSTLPSRAEVVLLAVTEDGVKRVNTATRAVSNFNTSITNGRGIVQFGNFVYVATTAGTVIELRLDGTTTGRTITTAASGFGNLNAGLAVDNSGNFYLGNESNKVRKYDSSWGYIGEFAVSGSSVRGVAVNGTNLFVATNGNGTYKYSSLTPGATASTFVSSPTNSQGLAIGADGNVYIADQNVNVRSYNPTTGALVSTYNTFNDTMGVAIDANGNVWASNFAGDSVEQYNGTPITVGNAARYITFATVPEPGTLLLGGIAAACGGGGVWWKRRRRPGVETPTEEAPAN